MGHDNKEVVREVEWRINVADDSLERSAGLACIWAVTAGLAFKLCKFVRKAWELGVDDPRKFIHCLKVGVALSAVSLFYYMKPLYDGVGGNSMWAVMTVVVVFEYTAGMWYYIASLLIISTVIYAYTFRHNNRYLWIAVQINVGFSYINV